MTNGTPTTAWPAEVQRRIRGHRFYPPKAVARRIPQLYATEGTPTDDKVVHLHYFTGSFDWYVVEVDPESGRAFGLTVVNAAREWGYISLPELEAIRPRGSMTPATLPIGSEGFVATGSLQWVVERDCHWTPGKVSEVVRS